MDNYNLKLVIALARTNNTLFSKIEKSLTPYALSVSEFGVLEFLYHKGKQPVQQIAEKILVTSGTITYIIDKLTQKGFVSRQQCQEDKRKFYVELTDSGRQVIAELFPEHERFLESLFKGVDQSSKKALIKALFALRDSMDDSVAHK